jgi:hypothetical protein
MSCALDSIMRGHLILQSGSGRQALSSRNDHKPKGRAAGTSIADSAGALASVSTDFLRQYRVETGAPREPQLARLRRPGSGQPCPLDSILTHLQAIGEIRRIAGEPERWAA